MRNRTLDGGGAVVQAFRDLGIEFVFSSPGSEWGAVWEAFARQKIENIAGPTFLNCGHETLAVDLAIGYTMLTGRMQATLLHAGSGLMQGAIGVYGARTLEVPMVLMSGEALTYGEDEKFDPGMQWYAYLSVVGGPQTLMEHVVKWATQAPSSAVLYEMVKRAGELAQRVPKGPTYLNVPIETLMQPWTPPERVRSVPQAPRHHADAVDIRKVADLLVQAKNPVITTESGGRERAGYEALVALAELLAIPVVESPVSTVANFPRDSVLHQGFDLEPMLEEADLVLMVRNRVPWYPPKRAPRNATVVAIDENPFKSYMVYQNLHADLYLEGDVPSTLGKLAQAIRVARPDADGIKVRRENLSLAHGRMQESARIAIAKAREAKGVHSVNLCATLGDVLPRDTIYVDETTAHRGQIHRFVQNHGLHSFLRVPSGLGQCLGVALGAKLASPQRLVVALVGDGSFVYNPAVAALAFARQEKLPIMVVIFNNHGYRSMRDNHLSYYPEGIAAKNDLFYGEGLGSVEYERLAGAFGGVGIRVEAAAELAPALHRAHETVANGNVAIVNVLLAN